MRQRSVETEEREHGLRGIPFSREVPGNRLLESREITQANLASQSIFTRLKWLFYLVDRIIPTALLVLSCLLYLADLSQELWGAAAGGRLVSNLIGVEHTSPSKSSSQVRGPISFKSSTIHRGLWL